MRRPLAVLMVALSLVTADYAGVSRADAKSLLVAIDVGPAVHLHVGRHVFAAGPGKPAGDRAPRPASAG